MNNKIAPVQNGMQDLLPGIKFYLDITNSNITFSDLCSIIRAPSLRNYFFFDFFSKYTRSTFLVYPPLAPLSYSLFYFFSTPGTGIEVMANTLYLAIALFSIYGIAKKIFNQNAGLLSAFIFSSFAGVISISRKVYSEFILMCLVTLSLYLLLKTDFFLKRRYSAALGVSLSLAALAKWEFVPALIGPFVLVLWKLNKIKEKERWLNFLLAIVIGVLISLPWYSLNFKDIVWRLFIRPEENIFINNPTTFNNRIFSMETLTYYPLAIINTHIGFFYFLVLSVVLINFSYRIVNAKNESALKGNNGLYFLLLALWLIIPYLTFTSVKINAPSHIMIILPAIAIVIGAGIFILRNRFLRIIIVSLVIFYGLISHLHSFLNFGKIESVFKAKLVLSNKGIFTVASRCVKPMRDCWEVEYFGQPDIRDWKIKDMLSFIKEDSSNSKHKLVVLILSPGHFRLSPPMTCFAFQYYNLLKRYNFFIEPRGNDRTEFPKDISKFDYIVINTYEQEINETALREAIKTTPNVLHAHKLNDLEAEFFEKYRLVKNYILPDGITAKIYKLNDLCEKTF